MLSIHICKQAWQLAVMSHCLARRIRSGSPSWLVTKKHWKQSSFWIYISYYRMCSLSLEILILTLHSSSTHPANDCHLWPVAVMRPLETGRVDAINSDGAAAARWKIKWRACCLRSTSVSGKGWEHCRWGVAKALGFVSEGDNDGWGRL